MSLLPNRGAPLAPTHQPIPNEELLRLAGFLRERADAGHLKSADVDAMAAELSVERAHLYAAAAIDPNLVIDFEHKALFAVCTGGCQAQGSIDLLSELLQVRDSRRETGKPGFDVVPRACLDMCAHAPVGISRSEHGMAAHPRLKKSEISNIVGSILDG